jgi:hypothetical protein
MLIVLPLRIYRRDIRAFAEMRKANEKRDKIKIRKQKLTKINNSNNL